MTLNQRIQIERDTITRTKGVESRVPSIVATLWARADAISGREYWQSQQVNSEASWKFTIRYGPSTDIRASDRIVYADGRYEIVAIIPGEVARDYTTLMCKRLNAA